MSRDNIQERIISQQNPRKIINGSLFNKISFDKNGYLYIARTTGEILIFSIHSHDFSHIENIRENKNINKSLPDKPRNTKFKTIKVIGDVIYVGKIDPIPRLDFPRFSHRMNIDKNNDRLLIADIMTIEIYSLKNFSWLTTIKADLSGPAHFADAIFDKQTGDIIIVTKSSGELKVISAEDYTQKRHINNLTDYEINRILIDCETNNILIDKWTDHGQKLFMLKDSLNDIQNLDNEFFTTKAILSHTNTTGCPLRFCPVNLGRIIVYDANMTVYDRNGDVIFMNEQPLSFSTEGYIRDITFDELRGVIAIIIARETNDIHSSEVCIFEANSWIPQTYIWSPDTHCYAPEKIKKTIEMVTVIRSLTFPSVISLLPNELLFEIFSYFE